MKSKPMLIIFFIVLASVILYGIWYLNGEKPRVGIVSGGLIVILGTGIGIWATFYHNKSSSEKSELILAQNEALKQQNDSLQEQLKVVSDELIAYQTGGDSYCQLIISPLNNTDANVQILATGKYPVNTVTVTRLGIGPEINYFEKHPKEKPFTFYIEKILPNSIAQATNLKSDFSDKLKKFAFTIVSQNDVLTQITYLYNAGDKWVRSTKVTSNNSGKTVNEYSDSSFPQELIF